MDPSGLLLPPGAGAVPAAVVLSPICRRVAISGYPAPAVPADPMDLQEQCGDHVVIPFTAMAPGTGGGGHPGGGGSPTSSIRSPTTNDDVQKMEAESEYVCTRCMRFFFFLLICMLSSRWLSTKKFLHRSSVGSLLRVRCCWLGVFVFFQSRIPEKALVYAHPNETFGSLQVGYTTWVVAYSQLFRRAWPTPPPLSLSLHPPRLPGRAGPRRRLRERRLHGLPGLRAGVRRLGRRRRG